jgi:hypothetical protein
VGTQWALSKSMHHNNLFYTVTMLSSFANRAAALIFQQKVLLFFKVFIEEQ